MGALHAFSAPLPVSKSLATQQAWSAAFTHAMDQAIGGDLLTQPFRQHPTVHAAVSAISSAISSLPREMFPDSDVKRETPIKDSVVGELLADPGNDVDGNELIEGTIDFMKLGGDAFWFLDGFARRSASGPMFPTRIDLWDPEKVRAMETSGRRVTRWEYRDSAGRSYEADGDRVIQFKHFNPYDQFRGLAPLEAAIIAAQGGYKALQYQKAFFDNSAVPYGIIAPKEGQIVQPEAMVRLRDEMEARQQGVGKHGRIGAINSMIEFLELGMSHKDMDFPLWLDASSAFILMVYKVPPSVAGLQKDANYNESVHQSKRFWYNHAPLVGYFERRIKSRLCKPFGIEETLYFKTESIKALIEDQESVTNQARNLWNMGVSFADINERLELGYPADDKAAQTRWVAFSLVNADEQAKAPANDGLGGPDRNPVPGDTPAQPGDESTVADDPTDGKRFRPRLLKNADSREFVRTANWRTLIGKVRDEEGAYQSKIRQHFLILEKEVLFNLRTRRKAAEDVLVISIDDVLFDKEKAAKQVRRDTDPIYKSALLKGYESVIRELGIDLPFDLLTPEVESFLAEKRFEIADLIDGPAEDRLRAALQDGVANGENLEKIADRVSEVFDMERSRARRIARTEVAESFNGGRFETMKAAEVEKLEWLTARDARVREEHVSLDGQIVTLGDRFSNGLLYPLDPAGPAEEIVNCRCVALPAA